MSLHQHNILSASLQRCKSPWILSYDDVPEVIEMYKDFNILRLSVKYSFGSQGKSRKIDELLITNFKSKKPQLDIFDESLIEIEVITDKERDKIIYDFKLKSEKELEEKLKEPKIATRPKPAGEQRSLFD